MPAQGTSRPGTAAAGVGDPNLAQLLVDHWEWTLRQSPVRATTLGEHRFDDQLARVSPAAIAAAQAARREFLRRARTIDGAALGEADGITLALLTSALEAEIAAEVCVFEQWSLSARNNPLTRFNNLPRRHKVRNKADGDNLIARYQAIASVVDEHIANLRRGVAAGMFANAESVRRTVAMVDGQLQQPLDQWLLMSPAQTRYADWPQAAEKDFQNRIRTIVQDAIVPAYRRYRDMLVAEVMPGARAERIGLLGLPQGQDCYAAMIQRHIAIAKTPAQLHQLGLDEIRRINDEMRVLGQKLFGSDELAQILIRLRSDPALYFADAEDILGAARTALAAAKQAMPNFFGIVPAADCTVVPIPDYEAPYTTIAYYRQPHADGSKPGEYFINTYQPKTRPRYELQVLSYHESIPGHHLQIAIAQERNALPAFRRHTGSTAFIEGWALYTERLADEMGLYSGDLDRMGMLSYDAWRASRLVVDTGIHAMGWTRARSEQFMREHTALTDNNIRNEVDRYITSPGQALAYKVGQLEILRLRGVAQGELGARFDIKSFHDAVLRNGGVTLPVLEQQIARWVASVKGQP